MKDLKLEIFDIESNNFHGKLPKDLFSMIGIVQLSSNRFTGTLPNVETKSVLTFLDISANEINGTIPAGIGRASQLTRLNLSLNQITGKIPSSIADLNALTNCKLQHDSILISFNFSNVLSCIHHSISKSKLPDWLCAITNFHFDFTSSNKSFLQ